MRENQFRTTFREYKDTNCGHRGRQKSNLTRSQQSRLESLLKRVAEEEVRICVSDKTGKLFAVKTEAYLKMGVEHTKSDQEGDWETCKEIQRVLNRHISQWIKILGVGKQWNHTQRLRETCLSDTISVNPLHLLIKDH